MLEARVERLELLGEVVDPLDAALGQRARRDEIELGSEHLGDVVGAQALRYVRRDRSRANSGRSSAIAVPG